MFRFRLLVGGVLVALCVVSVAPTGLPLLAQVPSAVGVWTTKAPMPTPRAEFAAGVANGVLYAVGGRGLPPAGLLSTVEAYNPATNTWRAKAPMPTRRFDLAVGVVTGILYALGGEGEGGVDIATVEAYDPVANSWTTRAPMPTAREGLAAAVVNGILYAVGGWHYSEDLGEFIPVPTVEAYDPATDTWTTKAPMLRARTFPAAGVVNGILYVVGSNSGVDPTVEAYDPTANTWTARRPMPGARPQAAAGVVKGILYAVGGLSTATATAVPTVEAYDPLIDTWAGKSPMPTARGGHVVAVVNGVLYAVGGFNGSSALFATNEAFVDGIRVQVDIKPGIFPNRISLNSPGLVHVAILTTSAFNAADVVAMRVRLAEAAPTVAALRDVDSDGDRDLLLQVPIRKLNLACTSTTAILIGPTKTNVSIVGIDSVRIVRDKAGHVCR